MPFGRGEGRDAFRWEVKGSGDDDGEGVNGGTKKKKKRINDRGVQTQHPTIENLIRMKDFVRVGEEVAREEAGVPIWVRREEEEEEERGGGGKMVFGIYGDGRVKTAEKQGRQEEGEGQYVEETVLEMGSGHSMQVNSVLRI